MIHFQPEEYSRNVKFLKKQGIRVETFFVSDGFDLDPFEQNNRPWKATDKVNADGAKVYKNTGICDFILPDGEVCRVPLNFEWDGASIPKPAQFLIGKPMGKYALAAELHDWLYSSRILGTTKKARKKADYLFLLVMKQLDIAWWRRKLMYRAVRLGGGSAYFDSDERAQCQNWMKKERLFNPWKQYKEKFPNSLA